MEPSKQYDPKEVEPKWRNYWEEKRIFEFKKDSKNEIFSIDTPPPTVSGKMHLGHAFSYSQQDFVARYKRMAGFNVFYPFGTDDNGIPTERLIEKTKNVLARNMERKNFIKLCVDTLNNELRPKYIEDWKRIGISCDWNIFYTTINEHCQKISQREFLNLYSMKRAYRKEAPSMWCPDCQTGISQVECIDKELPSFFNDIVFKTKNENLIIATTRPELLPACVAVFYHPDDKRYQHLKNKTAKVPLFNFEVPILEDERADPEKGTGIVMCCTFGDQTDMEWQKAHNLPIKEAIGHDGKMTAIAEKYKGLSIPAARKAIIEDMKEKNLLLGQKPITHAVNVHERCGTEVEFIKSQQWFIKYLDLKKDMLKWGRKLKWYPEHMRNRYENWVNGLQWDWLISRQRYFGVPFPIWYCSKCDEIITADENSLPVDPLRDKPKTVKCPKCGNKEFIAEKDVLDTWATSSLSPRLSVELMPKDLWPKLFPMSLRPQAHDIITFWLFNTTFRSNIHYKENPWKDCMISGWALDPKGKKMSKSKGNIIEPQEMIEKYSADCLRFWAAGSKLGEDLAFLEKDLVTGQKFVTKFWNASKFTIMHLQDCKRLQMSQKSQGDFLGHLKDYSHEKPKNLEAFDRWLLSKLNSLIKTSTEAFDNYEYSRTKADTEKFFWQSFCDNYLEIVKDRLYNPDKRGAEQRISAQYTLYHALLNCLKLIAPITPYFTEEIYHLYFAEKERHASIHVSEWPKYSKSLDNKEIEAVGDSAVGIIAAVRKYKAENKMSLKDELRELIIKAKEPHKLKPFLEDLKATLKIKEIKFEGIAPIEINPDLKIGILI